MMVLTVGQVFFQPIQALTFQMVPLIFQMVCKKQHMTKLIARKKLQRHIISGEQKLMVNHIFFFNSRSCFLHDKNWQENKKISEHFAGQFASRTLKPYAILWPIILFILDNIRLRKVHFAIEIFKEVQLDFSLTFGLKHPIQSIP
jgi:hypothetical protein